MRVIRIPIKNATRYSGKLDTAETSSTWGLAMQTVYLSMQNSKSSQLVVVCAFNPSSWEQRQQDL